MNIDMSGKVALVTGAASGLGKATALKLAKTGANLSIVDVNAEALGQTESELKELGITVRSQVMDQSDQESCAQVVANTATEMGRLDALCNVAGIIKFCNAHEMNPDDWNKVIAVNLNGPFYLIQAAIPHLLKTNGAVVNVTSSAAFVGEAYVGAYCASKAGLNHLTKALAMEYSHQDIRFNAVAPGGMVTNIVSSIQPPEGADIELIKRYSGLRGTVEVDDVADIITMLSSDAGHAYHGACINIDKGITAG